MLKVNVLLGIYDIPATSFVSHILPGICNQYATTTLWIGDSSMSDFYKVWIDADLADSYEQGNATDITKSILLAAMDNSRTVTTKIALSKAISGLTDIHMRSIQRSIAILEKQGIGEMQNEFSFVVDKAYASKTSDNKVPPIDWSRYSEKTRQFVAQFHILFGNKKKPQVIRTKKKDKEMELLVQTLKQQLDLSNRLLEAHVQRLAEAMQLLNRIACGEQVSEKEIKGQLISIKGGK